MKPFLDFRCFSLPCSGALPSTIKEVFQFPYAPIFSSLLLSISITCCQSLKRRYQKHLLLTIEFPSKMFCLKCHVLARPLPLRRKQQSFYLEYIELGRWYIIDVFVQLKWVLSLFICPNKEGLDESHIKTYLLHHCFSILLFIQYFNKIVSRLQGQDLFLGIYSDQVFNRLWRLRTVCKNSKVCMNLYHNFWGSQISLTRKIRTILLLST